MSIIAYADTSRSYSFAYIQPFSESSDKAIKELTKLSKSASKEFTTTLKYFGEPISTKAADFFNVIASFLNNFEVGMPCSSWY